MPRVFLSHSAEDRDIFLALARSLRRSGLEVWDYRDFLDPVPAGELNVAGLSRKIDQCDWFVLLLTDSASASMYVRAEVTAAEQAGFRATGRYIPLLVEPRFTRDSELEDDRSCILMERDGPSACSRAAALLLARLGVDVGAGHIGPPLAPLTERLQCELASSGDVRALSLYRYNTVMDLAAEIEACMDRREPAPRVLTRARDCIEDLLRLLVDLVPQYQPYYLRILEATCWLQLGDVRRAKACLLTVKRHDNRDENYFGLLGQCFDATNEHAIAARMHALAVVECRKAGRTFARARYNEICSRFLAGENLGDLELRELDEDLGIPEGRRLAAHLQVVILLRARRIHEAFARLREAQFDNVEWACAVADTCQRLGLLEAAREALRLHVASRGPSTVALQRLARLAVAAGALEEAVETYDRIGERNARYTVEAIRVLLLAGRAEEAQARCRAVVQEFVEPQDFYWHGLAHHILGNTAVAQYLLEQSRRDGVESGPVYGQLLRDDSGDV